MRLLDRAGRVMPFRFDHGFMDPITRHPGPVVLGPAGPLTVAIDKYRCDTTTNPPSSHTARLWLPGVSRAYLVPAAEQLCDVAQDGPNVVNVPPLGAFRPPLRHYAAPIGSPFTRGGGATWGSADVDGDGHADVVVLTGRGSLEVRLATGRTLTRTVPTWGRLQAFADLDADGTDEILIGYTAAGCATGPAGYDFCDSSPAVLTLNGGALTVVRGLRLEFNNGRGDVYAGVTCSGNTITQISATLTGQPTMTVKRVTWRLTDGHADRISATHRLETGNPLALTASRCAGMKADGWTD